MKTPAQKLESTRQAITLFLGACGPADMGELVREVKTQAYPAYLPKALHQLRVEGLVSFDPEYNDFDLEVMI